MLVKMVVIIALYVIGSILTGVVDSHLMLRQAQEIETIPVGDMQYYRFDRIWGVHNFILLPSWIPILITWLRNK